VGDFSLRSGWQGIRNYPIYLLKFMRWTERAARLKADSRTDNLTDHPVNHALDQ